VVLCAGLLAVGAGCAGISLFGTPRPDPASQMPALEMRIFDLIQDDRHKIDPKAQTLVLDSELVGVARKRSSDMAKAHSFGGDGDPHAAATMLMSEDAQFQGLIGENVAAQHFTPGGVIDVNILAERFVASWLASKPHQQNLSFAEYNRSGVGAAVNGDTIYVTQLFATDLGLGPHSDSAPPSQVESVASPQKAKDDQQTLPLRGAIVPGAPAN
jgi:uncharacterized protein YkwD